MNLKLNNNDRNVPVKYKVTSSVKEERRRTGRYIAILVGISLLILAIYHAWVRRIPVVASLVVPALIMFIYVAWVLYTASRDKHRAAQAALNAISQDAVEDGIVTPNNIELSIGRSRTSSIENENEWKLSQITSIVSKGDRNSPKPDGESLRNTIKPLILVNDEIPIDLDEKPIVMTSVVVETLPNASKIKNILNKRRFRRKYCRRKNDVFKRSYSIA